jgi:hypothetical protein
VDIKETRHRVYARRDVLVKSGLTVSEALTQAWAEIKAQDNPIKPVNAPSSKVSETRQTYDPQQTYHVNNSAKTDFEDKYPPTYRTEDGHWVRSRAEVIIDDWLYSHNIMHAYERKLPGGNYRCDFYIPCGNVYIEFWGLVDEKYLASKATKSEIYRNNTLKLIELFDKDLSRLGDILPDLLRKHKVPVQ